MTVSESIVCPDRQYVNPPFDYQLPLFTDSMIHHKSPRYSNRIIVYTNRKRPPPPYGVSPSRRVITPGLLIKYHHQVWNFLAETLGLTISQREVTMRLLRLWAYYGQVYPKESLITSDPGCSKATFWRTIKKLEALGLVRVFNRYLIRPHAQISNLYKFDRLLLVLARYLAEHGVRIWTRWVQPYLTMPGASFWPWVFQTPGARAGPF